MGMILSLIALRIAGKVDDLKKKHPDLSEQIEKLHQRDPSKKDKYLDWSIKQILRKHKLEDIIPTIELFNKKYPILEKKDINQYEDLKELEDLLKSLPETSKRQEKIKSKSSGAVKLFEDGKFVLVRVDEKKACIEYGKGTKWCITMEDAYYFEEYNEANTVFYFLINKNPTEEEIENHTDKIAFAVQRDLDNKILETEIFKSDDEQISQNPYGEISSKIESVINADAPKAPEGLLVRLQKGKVPDEELVKYKDDNSEYVKGEVAKRIDPKYLPEMLENAQTDIVMEPAMKRMLENGYDVNKLINSKNTLLRRVLVDTIDPKYLPKMMKDKDHGVRQRVVQKIAPEYLTKMTGDPNEYVMEELWKRMREEGITY